MSGKTTMNDARFEIVEHPGELDVLLGRGGAANMHSGNRAFRKLISAHKKDYFLAKRNFKARVVQTIMTEWKKQGGRWLARLDDAYQEADGVMRWYVVDETGAKKKTAQCLREKTTDIMPLVREIKEKRRKSMPMFLRGNVKLSLPGERRRSTMPLVSSSVSSSWMPSDTAQAAFTAPAVISQISPDLGTVGASYDIYAVAPSYNLPSTSNTGTLDASPTGVHQFPHQQLPTMDDYHMKMIYYRRKLDALEAMFSMQPPNNQLPSGAPSFQPLHQPTMAASSHDADTHHAALISTPASVPSTSKAESEGSLPLHTSPVKTAPSTPSRSPDATLSGLTPLPYHEEPAPIRLSPIGLENRSTTDESALTQDAMSVDQSMDESIFSAISDTMMLMSVNDGRCGIEVGSSSVDDTANDHDRRLSALSLELNLLEDFHDSISSGEFCL